MLERRERISFRISSFLSKVKPDLHTGSDFDQKVPAPTGSATMAICLFRVFLKSFPFCQVSKGGRFLIFSN